MENGNIQFSNSDPSGESLGGGVGKAVAVIFVVLVALAGLGLVGYKYVKTSKVGSDILTGGSDYSKDNSAAAGEFTFTDCNQLITEEKLSQILGNKTIYVDFLKETPSSKPYMNGCRFNGPEGKYLFGKNMTTMPMYQGLIDTRITDVETFFKIFDPGSKDTIERGFSVIESTTEIGRKTTIYGLNLDKGIIPLAKTLNNVEISPKDVPEPVKMMPPSLFVQFLDDDAVAHAVIRISSSRSDIPDMGKYVNDTISQLKQIAVEVEKNIK